MNNTSYSSSNFGNQFRAEVSEHFGFLNDDLGFSLHENPNLTFLFSSQHILISVFLDHGMLVTRLKPLQLEIANDGGVDLNVMISCLHPDWKREPIIINDFTALDRALAEDAGLLKQFLHEYLLGNFSSWSRVTECLKQRAISSYEKWFHLSPAQANTVYETIRVAQNAMSKNDFKTAIHAYESIMKLYPSAETEIEALKIFDQAETP